MCLNLMPEKDESGAGKSDIILVNTPGLALFCTLPDSPLRAKFHVSTAGVAPRDFAVAGSTLFEIFADGTIVNRGAVANDGKPASIASSNIQIMIASGGQGYCLTLATNAFTGPIATLVGATQVIYVDGFFIISIGTSAQWFVSNLEDGVDWDPGQTAIVSVFPDNVVSMNTILRTICLLGKKKSVCYYDSGNVFPFDVVPGGTNEQGSAATFGTVPSDNTLFGIWEDERGKGVAFRAQGYTFQRISTHAIENIWDTYAKASTISDAIAQSHQIAGHTIIQWTFPSAANGVGRTWCYDVATGLWFEKGLEVNGVQYAHPSAFHSFSFGKHLVGDLTSGNIYEMSMPVADVLGGWSFVTDNGVPIRRVRRAPYIGAAGIVNQVSLLEIMADTGLGPNIPLQDGSGNFRGPQLMFRFSDDGGHNWSNQRTLDMGQIGNYGKRLRIHKLGSFWGSTGRIFELSFTDAAPLRITDGDLTGTPEMVPQKRLAQRLREQA